MSEYKPANIEALAKSMYQRECDYTGRDHEGYCVSENVKTLKSFEDEIERLRHVLDVPDTPSGSQPTSVLYLCHKCKKLLEVNEKHPCVSVGSRQESK